MIERHITFSVAPDRTADFERFFADRYRPAMSAAPGFVRLELLREAEDPARYRMVLRWRDVDAATGWRVSPAHEELRPDLAALSATDGIEVFDVVA